MTYLKVQQSEVLLLVSEIKQTLSIENQVILADIM